MARDNSLQTYARQIARRYGISPEIFIKQLNQESGFRTNAVSSAGARGPGQIMPGTAQDLARKLGVDVDDVLNDPRTNIEAAALYLSEQLKTFGGDYRSALAAYNAGPGAVQTHGGPPPYDETQAYLRSILGDDYGEDDLEDPDDELDPDDLDGNGIPDDEEDLEGDDEPVMGDDEPEGDPDRPFDLGDGPTAAPPAFGPGGPTGGQTMGDRYNLHPENQYADRPYSAANRALATAEDRRLRERDERRADAQAAEDRLRSRPRTGAAARGPLPLNRISKESLPPNNPYAGVDDILARRWEQTHGAAAPTRTSGGNIADMIARLRASILGQRDAQVPESIAPPAQLSGRFTNPPTTSGKAQDIWKNVQGFSGVGNLESSYFLPFFNEELGGAERGVSNALKSIGFDTTGGNPYVSHLQRLGNRMSSQAMLQRMMGGEVPDERVIASDILSALSAGKTRIFTPETLRSEISAMKGLTDLSPEQQSVLHAFETDPKFAVDAFETASNLPTDWQRYRRQSEARRWGDFLNKAPSMTNRSLLDFIQGGF